MKPLYTYILIIALIVGAFLLYSDDYPGDYFAFEQGFTVKGVSVDTPIITESTNLKNVKYIVDTSFDGGGQSIQGTVFSSKFAQSGYATKYDFTVKVDNPKETASYSIVNTGTPIYIYSSELVNKGECGANAAYVIKMYGDIAWISFHTNDICIYENIDARLGKLDSPNMRNSADITVGINDGLSSIKESFDVTKNIDTKTQKSVYFKDASGNRLCDATWTGNLVTGDTPPSESLYVTTYAVDGSTWAVSHENKWWLSNAHEYDGANGYVAARASALPRFREWRDFPHNADCDSLDACLDIINAEIALVNEKSMALTGGMQATIDGKAPTYVNRNNLGTEGAKVGEVIVSFSDRTINYMNVVFKISADWIGVVIDIGQPKILSVTCEDFASGDESGVCKIKVKNTGSGTGTFIATMDNCGIFSQRTTSKSITFSPGETDILYVTVEHGIFADETTRACEFTVTDVGDDENFDTMVAAIHMTAPKACIVGTCDVRGSCVYPCNTDGTGELAPLCCATDETLQMGTDNVFCGWYCKEKVTNGESDIILALTDALDAIMKGIFGEDLINKLFGEEFGLDDIIPAIVMVLIGFIGIIVVIQLIPIILPLLGKALLGLILRK